jgi:tetratricopeptide (TPR) repeat protein/tRNA A-37 threonylcarbamoyl transferase component Bud32
MTSPPEVEQTSVESAESSASSTSAGASASASAMSATSRMIDDVASTRLDRYVLVDLIGRGGFGMVWAAYDPQLDRRVAIKVMYMRKRKRNDTGPDVELEVMLGEAQMLAQINHPNVVAIYDVRVFDEPGGPRGLFIVMEHLSGPTLADWQSTPHDWREVLSIYVQAGRGLAAAHKRSLVHRDFKPANVMFGNDERIRVLDFGLARPTSSTSAQRSRDKPQRVVGTPVYMAPEQHLGHLTDAQGDQYSFCIALFEGLYGCRPFTGQDHETIVQAKLENEVHAPPHTKVPARILTVLRRGLALNPAHRYGNMHELLDALLDDPQARRRRFASLALLIAVMGGAGYGLARAQARATESCQAPDDSFHGMWDTSVAQQVDARFATIESDYAHETGTLVVTGLDDWTSRWRTAHEQACERAQARSKQFTADDPARLCLDRARRRLAGLTATLVEADAGVLARAPDAILGLPRPESCIERGESTPATSNELDAARRDVILQIEGEVEHARTLNVLGRPEEALAAAIAAREHAEAEGDHGGATAAAQLEASSLRALDRHDDALRANEHAASLAVQANDPESVARALLQQIDLRGDAGSLEAASALAGFARSSVPDGRFGPELDIDRDVTLGQLAQTLREYDESQRLFERALARATELYGPEHPNLSRIHNRLGNLSAERTGATDVAAMHFKRALEIDQRYYGEKHPAIAVALNNLATFHAERGDLTTALAEFEAALALNEDIYGQNSSHLIVPLLNIAVIQGILGRYEDGLRLEERAVSLAEASLPANHPMFADIYFERGKFHRSLGHLELAAADTRRALAVHEQVFGPTHPEAITMTATLAEQLRALGQLDEAKRLEQLVVEQLENELPDDAVTRNSALAHLARIDFDNRRFEKALERAQQRVVHLREAYGPGTQEVASAQVMVMRALLALERPAEALRIGEQALADLDVEGTIAGLWPLHQLTGQAELALGHDERAIAALEQALAALQLEQGLTAEREALTLELLRLRAD